MKEEMGSGGGGMHERGVGIEERGRGCLTR